MATMELEGRLAACSAQAEQSRLLAQRLQAAHSLQQSYAEGARLRAAEAAERHRLQLELAEVRPDAEGLEEGMEGSQLRRRGWRRGTPPAPTPSATPSPASEQVRAEVEERHWARTEQIIAEEADLATLLSARAAAEAAAPTAYTYEHALASAASAVSAISADEMESELEQAKAQLVAARRQSELARASLGARLQHSSPSNTPRTPVSPLLCASLAPPHQSSPEHEYPTQVRCASRVTPARPPRGTEGRPPRRHRSRPASRRR